MLINNVINRWRFFILYKAHKIWENTYFYIHNKS